MPQNFSSLLRQELFRRLSGEEPYSSLALRTAMLAAFRFQGKAVRFSTQHHEFATYLHTTLLRAYPGEIALSRTKSLSSILLEDVERSRALRADMEQYVQDGYSYFSPSLGKTVQMRNVAICLSSLFLACGSVASPSDAYHLEFSLQKPQALDFFLHVFQELKLKVGFLRHQGYYVLYSKEGQSLADFFLYSGAHQALLQFEALRVNKDVTMQVNRVVNCDAANADRVATSSARQRYAIQQIIQKGEFQNLSPSLQETALLRLANPELSLADLGQKLQPPLGKSGVNHRLQKIINFAKSLTQLP